MRCGRGVGPAGQAKKETRVFTTICERRWPGATGEGYRVYTCSGYHRSGKSVWRLVNVPDGALDAFVLATIKRLFLPHGGTVEQAIDRFVKAVLAPKRRPKPPRTAERELEAVNRKIKAVAAMLADPPLDGLHGLRPALSGLKVRRDSLQARVKPVAAEPAISERELRALGNRAVRPARRTGHAPQRRPQGPLARGGVRRTHRDRSRDEDGRHLRGRQLGAGLPVAFHTRFHRGQDG